MNEITRDSLTKKHGDKAGEVFAEIAHLGGFGDVGLAENNLDPNSALDIRGVLDPENRAVSAANKSRIKELLGGEKEEKK